jgi:hypothetical protein
MRRSGRAVGVVLALSLLGFADRTATSRSRAGAQFLTLNTVHGASS